MSEHAFTPGPWFVGTMNDALFILNERPRPAPVDSINPNAGKDTRVIAKLADNDRRADKDAQLLAASPELLGAAAEGNAAIGRLIHALNEFAPSHPDIGYGYDAQRRIRHAIAKSEGRG